MTNLPATIPIDNHGNGVVRRFASHVETGRPSTSDPNLFSESAIVTEEQA